MTHEEIYAVARRQSAIDLGCASEDFLRREDVIVPSRADPRARKYLSLPFSCQLVTYGGNVVASVAPELRGTVADYLAGCAERHYAFELPRVLALDEVLRPCGYRVCFQAEYFLPESEELSAPECDLALHLLEPPEFAALYRPEWSNALCEKRAHLDVLAVGAYKGDVLVGLAGCSADCEDMWQIGVDVLPAFRGRGIAPALTARLTREIFDRGKVPFYCAAWSNVKSVRNAMRCGYRPAWVELTARSEADTAAVICGE